MRIPRNFERTEHDDYVLNVQPHLDRDKNKEAVRLYPEQQYDPAGNLLNTTVVCTGWRIKYKFE